MSKSYEIVDFGVDRFCIIDSETGEILDDDNGYGYKTRQKAHAGWSYKRKSDSEKKAIKNIEQAVRSWIKGHRELEDEIEIVCWDFVHDGYSKRDLEYAIMEILRPFESELPCSMKQFVRIVLK